MQMAVALLGGAGLLLAILAGAWGDSARPAWLLLVLIGWAVVTPYWWYLEYRLFLPLEPAARDDFLARQSLSRNVWLGGLAALATLLWWRST